LPCCGAAATGVRGVSPGLVQLSAVDVLCRVYRYRRNGRCACWRCVPGHGCRRSMVCPRGRSICLQLMPRAGCPLLPRGVSPAMPVVCPQALCPQALPHGVVSLRLLRDVPVCGIGTMLRVLSVRQNFRAGVLVALLPCPCAGSGGVTDGVIRRGFGRCCAAVIDVVVCPQGMLELGGGVSPEELWCVPNACWS
jgi:hypothetical protein